MMIKKYLKPYSMKKTALLFILTGIIACTNTTTKTPETNSNNILWAETVKTILPMERDSAWNEADWKAAYKYDKEKMFRSITRGILAGKIKAYRNYPDFQFTPKDFQNFLVQWDSTATVEDPNNPGVFIAAPIKTEITPESVMQLKFDEKIELDTMNYTLAKKVSMVTFFGYKYNELGDILGIKKLFDVKLNDDEVTIKKE